MSNKQHLNIDLSPIWDYPQDTFTIRYNDINKKQQKILTKRIKNVPTISTIKTSNNFTPQTIHSVLQEINPIIFSERANLYSYRQATGQSFGIYKVRAITSDYYKDLCRSIYYLLKSNKNITSTQFHTIIHTTLYPYNQDIYEELKDKFFSLTNSASTHPLIEQCSPLNCEPISINQVRNTREQTESDNNDRPPRNSSRDTIDIARTVESETNEDNNENEDEDDYYDEEEDNIS